MPTHLIDYVVIEVSICITYSVLITIRICRFIPLVIFLSTVKDYVPVDSESVTHNMWVLLMFRSVMVLR